MDGNIFPAPVSWLRSCAANKLMRDINKMTAALWEDKSAEWAEHLIQHVQNNVLKIKNENKLQLEPRTLLPGLGCKDQNKSADKWRQAMGNSAAHGWRGRWTGGMAEWNKRLKGENVKKRGMKEEMWRMAIEGADYSDYSSEFSAIRSPWKHFCGFVPVGEEWIMQ